MLGLILPLAYAMDLLFGDPVYAWHPVRLIGRMVQVYEKKLRGFFQDEVRAGLFLAFGLPADVFLIVFFLLWFARELHPAFQIALGTFFIYSSLSVKDMADQAFKVRDALLNGELGEAREVLSGIVGRDTSNMDSKEIVRAVVETVAEGTLDGIISPFMYAGIGGAPLAMAYKAVSTLDSMVGYKNERYEKFGKFSACLDDWANFIPARVSPVIISLAAFASGLHGVRAFKTGFHEGSNQPGPNSGFPEASFAGALGVKLGGLNYYDGVPVEKSVMEKDGREPEIEDISRAVRLMYVSSFFAFVLAMAIWYFSWILVKRIQEEAGMPEDFAE